MRQLHEEQLAGLQRQAQPILETARRQRLDREVLESLFAGLRRALPWHNDQLPLEGGFRQGMSPEALRQVFVDLNAGKTWLLDLRVRRQGVGELVAELVLAREVRTTLQGTRAEIIERVVNPIRGELGPSLVSAEPGPVRELFGLDLLVQTETLSPARSLHVGAVTCTLRVRHPQLERLRPQTPDPEDRR